MRMQVYAVLDKPVEAFLPPFFARNDGEASRMFVHACGSGKSDLSDKVSDITLFHIGVFDDSSGMLEPVDAPRRMLSGLEAVGTADLSKATAETVDDLRKSLNGR